MVDIFVPFCGKKPAPLWINGHRLLILSTDKRSMEESLDRIGGDNVKKLKGLFTQGDQERVITNLAKKSKAGVVLTPQDLNVEDLIRNLESELPWVQ